MTQIQRRKGRLEKFAWWTVSLVFTAIFTAAITWNVTKTLDTNEKTRVFEYTYISTSQEESHGEIECWFNGINNRQDVYRCARDSQVLAPCFRDDKSGSDRVKCPKDPASDYDSKIYDASFSTSDFSKYPATTAEPTPWYIYLSSGEECVFVSGATYTISNKRMDFACRDSEVVLFLPTVVSEGVHTISCLKNNRLERCKIKEMWL